LVNILVNVVPGWYLQFLDIAKKKLKMLENEAASCLKASEIKANESLKKHNFNLLAQSVALRDKSIAMKEKEIANQLKLVQELQSKLVQKN
jgi:hypothetical protein